MQTDFLIVGGGAVGLTSAYALLQSGYSVTLVERGTIGREASWAGGGILSPLCPWDYREAVTRLTLHGMAMFGEAADLLHATTGIDPEYQRSGMLLLPPYQNVLASRWCVRHQFAMQSVKLADYLSGLGESARQETGLLLPEVAQVRNPRLLRALRKRVEMLGGAIIEQQDVQKFEIAGDRVVALHTSEGKLSADAYIVAAGAWSKTLLGEHALGMDIRPIRGQILLFKFDAPPFLQILLKENLYFIPRRDGHVLVGSTLEDAGFDKSTTTEARVSLLQRVREIFPGWQQMPVQHWAGLRPGSPDNIPTIGRHPHLTNLYANSGHFRYGVTMSLASAELLLNEIEGLPQPYSVKEYRWN
ncbi:MAG: glycine oxidase ThiO [Nitrosomonadales bacterium]|nr:glycine oxidase ThiO [Nitrosomonadales bacterium]